MKYRSNSTTVAYWMLLKRKVSKSITVLISGSDGSKHKAIFTIHSTGHQSFGVGFYGGSFDNNDFGEPNALYGFIDIPFYRSKSKWSWIYGIGLGLAFNFNPYNPETNPDNGLIGSEKNVYIALTIEGRYQITPHWEAGLGAGFKHFSNGRIQMPNSGINVVPVTFSQPITLKIPNPC